MVVLCLVGPVFLPAFGEQDLANQFLPPLSRTGSGLHWLGTDALGRDLLSRMAQGGRLSLAVALVASLVAVVVGTLYGAVSGWFGGRLDAFLMRVVEILQSLPYMFLVIVLMALLGRNLIALFAALGLVQWLSIARVVRAQVLSLRSRDFVTASRSLGQEPWRIVLVHVLPSCLGVISVQATLAIPQIILQEAFLSFLGLNASEVSWGLLVAEGAQSMDLAPWLVAAPGVLLALTLGSLQFLGEAWRIRMDPRSGRDQ
ncbi:MAG: hypothetical protein RL318_1090 [Fibrobacterota bacterium]|jgi:oligopeptide transport system permease protein